MNTEITGTHEFGPISRIIIAVDALHESLNVLELAAKLAAKKHIEMSVLFIEDVNLINYSGLPFAREVDLVSAADRQLDMLQMMRTLQSQAQKTFRLLERLASQLKIDYSFKILRGDYATEVQSVAMKTDVLFLSKRVGRYSSMRLERSYRFTRSTMPSVKMQNILCVVYDGSPGSLRALALAKELAIATDRNLLILLQSSRNESADVFRKQVAEITKDEENRVRCVALSERDSSSLARVLKREKCEMLIVHKSDEGQLAGMLLQDPGCPLVLVQ